MIQGVLGQVLQLFTGDGGRFKGVCEGISHGDVHAYQLGELRLGVLELTKLSGQAFRQRIHRLLRPIHIALGGLSGAQARLVPLQLCFRVIQTILGKRCGLLQQVDLKILLVGFVGDLIFQIIQTVSQRVDLRLDSQWLHIQIVLFGQIQLLGEFEAQQRAPPEAAQVLHLGPDTFHSLHILHLLQNDLVVLLADVAAGADSHALRLLQTEGAGIQGRLGIRGHGRPHQRGTQQQRAQPDQLPFDRFASDRPPPPFPNLCLSQAFSMAYITNSDSPAPVK